MTEATQLVDVHAHYLPRAVLDAFDRRTDPPCLLRDGDDLLVDCGHGLRFPVVAEMRSLEVQLARSADAGIGCTVLTVAAPGLDWLPAADAVATATEANDELAEAARSSDGRVAAVACLPNGQPEAAAAELRRAVAAGLSGGLMYSNVAGASLDAPQFQVIFEAAAELGVPIVLHPTVPAQPAAVEEFALMTTLGFLSDSTACALRLVFSGLYERHPDFKLLVPHVGAFIPYILGRVDYEASRYGVGAGVLTVPPSEHVRRFYTDSVCVWPAALRLALEVFGSERVMFGSDRAFWDAARSVETLEALELSGDEAEAIRAGNARAFFSLTA